MIQGLFENTGSLVSYLLMEIRILKVIGRSKNREENKN